MHLQQVAMDARDGFRFVRAARQVIGALKDPACSAAPRFNTPVQDYHLGATGWSLDRRSRPDGGQGLQKAQCPCAERSRQGLFVSQRLLPNYGKLRPQPDRANEFPRAGGGGNTSSTQLPNTEDAVCWWR